MQRLSARTQCELAALKHEMLELRRGVTSEQVYFLSQIPTIAALVCPHTEFAWLLQLYGFPILLRC